MVISRTDWHFLPRPILLVELAVVGAHSLLEDVCNFPIRCSSVELDERPFQTERAQLEPTCP